MLTVLAGHNGKAGDGSPLQCRIACTLKVPTDRPPFQPLEDRAAKEWQLQPTCAHKPRLAAYRPDSLLHSPGQVAVAMALQDQRRHPESLAPASWAWPGGQSHRISAAAAHQGSHAHGACQEAIHLSCSLQGLAGSSCLLASKGSCTAERLLPTMRPVWFQCTC